VRFVPVAQSVAHIAVEGQRLLQRLHRTRVISGRRAYASQDDGNGPTLALVDSPTKLFVDQPATS
jgi:hypothetical protein